jgi:D-glycero-alpha-D-manno-heptose-7-phosphate kinase
MIITRTPLRLSFMGGGSDLPAFYREEPGCVISTTIDKYVYLMVSPKYDGNIRVSYSHTENVKHINDLEHPLVRTALQVLHVPHGIEIASVADIPSGSGLGSSSSFTVGLLAALHAYCGEFATTDLLAHEAYTVERQHGTIGKQDQYAAAFGGLKKYQFHPDQRVSVETLPVQTEILAGLEKRLLLFDTGVRREASGLLAAQSKAMWDSRKRADVRSLANLAHTFGDALVSGDLYECRAD